MAAEPPSRPGMDAPELARLGNFAVGVKTIVLVDRDQIDLGTFDAKTGVARETRPRSSTVDIWYPARPRRGAATETYSASMDSEPPAPPAAFEMPGIAVRDAPSAEAGRFPLVIVAHGYGNVTVGMSWLTENLASKGYVVAAIRHEDRYLDPRGLPACACCVARSTSPSSRASCSNRWRSDGSVDAGRTALIGYSMGGYGVLTAGGAVLDPASPLAGLVPGGIMQPYMRGGASSASMRAPAVKAVVAISPAGGALAAWGANGLEGITAPLLLISGDRDLTVDYASGARAFFDQATRSNRYLLTFHNGGHALGLGPAPPGDAQDALGPGLVRGSGLAQGPAHRHQPALHHRVPRPPRERRTRVAALTSMGSSWSPARAHGPQPPETPWGAYSPGGEGVTLWKGFQRRHAEGLSLMHAKPTAP